MSRTGVDGIITNHPERLFNVLREKEFVQKFRMATLDDNPFKRFRASTVETPSPLAPIMQPIGIRIANGMGDMFTSFTKYVGDFVYLRVPQLWFRGKSLSDEPLIIQLLANIIQSKNSKKTQILDENQTNKSE